MKKTAKKSKLIFVLQAGENVILRTSSLKKAKNFQFLNDLNPLNDKAKLFKVVK
jgi:hypothetical protein